MNKLKNLYEYVYRELYILVGWIIFRIKVRNNIRHKKGFNKNDMFPIEDE